MQSLLLLLKSAQFGYFVCLICCTISGVRRMNEVNARLVRLVLGWVTVFGQVYNLGM